MINCTAPSINFKLLNIHYSEHSAALTSADPPYITPDIKYMLRWKNHLMRLGKSAQAAALAGKIGVAIKECNSAQLSRVDILIDPSTMCSKVRHLTGGRAETHASNTNLSIRADVFNNHYTARSNDAIYVAPSVKLIRGSTSALC